MKLTVIIILLFCIMGCSNLETTKNNFEARYNRVTENIKRDIIPIEYDEKNKEYFKAELKNMVKDGFGDDYLVNGYIYRKDLVDKGFFNGIFDFIKIVEILSGVRYMGEEKVEKLLGRPKMVNGKYHMDIYIEDLEITEKEKPFEEKIRGTINTRIKNDIDWINNDFQHISVALVSDKNNADAIVKWTSPEYMKTVMLGDGITHAATSYYDNGLIKLDMYQHFLHELIHGFCIDDYTKVKYLLDGYNRDKDESKYFTYVKSTYSYPISMDLYDKAIDDGGKNYKNEEEIVEKHIECTGLKKLYYGEYPGFQDIKAIDFFWSQDVVNIYKKGIKSKIDLKKAMEFLGKDDPTEMYRARKRDALDALAPLIVKNRLEALK